jgi:hypothetical protein
VYVLAVAGMSGTTSVFQTPAGLRARSNVFGVVSPAPIYFEQLLALGKQHGYHEIGIVYQTDNALGPDADVCLGAAAAANDNHMPVVVQIGLPLANATSAQAATAIRTALATVQERAPPIVLVCANVQCGHVFDAFVGLDYMPPVPGLNECLNEFTTYPATMAQAQWFFGPLQWDPRLSGREYSDASPTVRKYANFFPPTANQTSAALFMAAYASASVRLTGRSVPVTSFTAAQLAAVYLVQYAFVTAAATSGGMPTGAELVAAAQSINTPSTFGTISADQTGQNSNRAIPIIQMVDTVGGTNIVSPLIGDDAVMPAPTWAERVYIPATYATAGERTWIAFASVLTFAEAAVLVLIVTHRHYHQVKAQSVPLSIVLLIGCMGLLWVPATFSTVADDVQCRSRLAAWLAAFICVFAPILITTRRIDRIVNRRQLTTARQTNKHAFADMLLYSLPHIIVIILAVAFNDDVPTVIVTDENRPSLNHTVCSTAGGAWTSSLAYVGLAFTCVFLCVILRYAYRIRSVGSGGTGGMDLEAFNNGKLVSVLVCVGTILIAVGCIVQFAIGGGGGGANASLNFALVVFLSFVLSVTCVALYFWDPLLAIVGRQEQASGSLNHTVVDDRSSKASAAAPPVAATGMSSTKYKSSQGSKRPAQVLVGDRSVARIANGDDDNTPISSVPGMVVVVHAE